MTATASQLQFAANLVTLLVAAAGLVLVALRSELTAHARWARPLAAAAFVVIGAAAFVRGSLLIHGHAQGVAAARLAGDLLLAAATLGWSRHQLAAWVLRAGLALSVAAAVMEATESLDTAADATLIAGGVGLAVGLAVGGRHSVVARLATAVAASLLLVVLVVSVALSSVISASAQRDALNALRSRAAVEGNQTLTTVQSTTEDARFVAADLAAVFQPANPNPLVELAGAAAPPATAPGAASTQVSARLGVLRGLYPVTLGYVVAGSQQLVTARGAPDVFLLAVLAQTDPTARVSCADTSGRSGLDVQSATAVAVAAYPVCLTSTPTLLGTVLVASPLDHVYLAGRQRVDPSTSLTLVTPRAVLAAAGDQPAAGALLPFASQVEASNRAATIITGGHYLAGEPLDPDRSGPAANVPVAVLVASSTGHSVTTATDRLERTLFLIALGGTLIALLVVAAVGDRVTRGLRLLTEVADRVRRGATGERAEITSPDEVGRLGATFNSMMGSVEAQTAALQTAADDETRLRNRLQAVVAGMGDALVATDADGVVTEFNAAAEELTETPVSEAVGHRVEGVLSLVDEEGVALSSRLAHPGVGRWATMATLLRPGGDEVPVAVSCGALRGPAAEVAGSVLVLRDLRREQELDRMKSELLSRVGHELRTPLTGIMGYAEILLSREVSHAAADQWHQEILASSKRLLRIVELLEFFASTGAGRMLLRLEPVDVRVLVRGVTAAWAGRVSPAHGLGRRVARHTPPVLADQRWLMLAIDELVDNAVKFSPEGGRVVLAAGPGADGTSVEISVIDRGMGMTAEQRAAAFGEFQQAEASDTRRFGGLGLGLPLVQRVVEGHHGSVSCTSTPGEGSTFTIRLPAFGSTRGLRPPRAPQRNPS